MIENQSEEIPLAGFREPNEGQPLPLPFGRFLISAAQKAERLHWLAAQMHQLITHAPSAVGEFTTLHGQALDAWSEIDEHYRAHLDVLECKGQA